MGSFGTSHTKSLDSDLEQVRTRLLARLCVIFICITQIFQRVYFALDEPNVSRDSKIAYLASLPFLIAVSIIAGVEYIFFRRIGSKILKYSKIVDFAFFLIFTVEWIATLYSGVIKAKPFLGGYYYSVTAVFGFTSFSWRTLLQTFISQRWQLKMIPPIAAKALVMGYAIHYASEVTRFTLIRGLFQISYLVVLFYFEDKIRLRMMLCNMQQGKWVQINQFILNNIPENIVILDLGGKPMYISHYLKEFMEKCHCESDMDSFFQKVKNLQKQETEPSGPSDLSNPTERNISLDIILEQNEENTNHQPKLNNLQELITNFQKLITKGYLPERSFRIYNGKLRVDELLEKSIEVKISFIEQHEKKYIILILRDTTQRDLLVTLQDNNKYKDQLLASVSHELRAPLNGNINLVESAIQSSQVPENIKETLLTPALRSSKFLLHLINDILDMSQIQAKKLRLSFLSASIKETLFNVIQLVELQAKRKGIKLQLSLDPGVPETFCTDHVRLSQIVLNLLNNSIKFTQEGFVQLNVSPVHGRPWIKISVEDSGIGMQKDDLNKLFRSFTHIEFQGRESINPTGVGLGLNIASNLVGLLGPQGENQILVSSTPNRGSKFTFILENKDANTRNQLQIPSLNPIKGESDEFINVPNETELELVHVLSERMSSYSLSSPRKKMVEFGNLPKPSNFSNQCNCAQVLIVDDNPFNTLAFETILEALDVKFDSVYNAKDSIEKILNRSKQVCGKGCQPYSLVFMDQEMPGMTGSEAVREIRKLESQNLIPGLRIMGCTAHGGWNEVEKFMESGINRCIHKPISIELIKEVLTEAGIKFKSREKIG